MTDIDGKQSALLVCGVLVLVAVGLAAGQPADVEVAASQVKQLTVTGEAAGTGPKVRDEAVSDALRKAVKQACGVFLRAQSKTKDYRAVYDKVLANTGGYVLEHKIVKVYTAEGLTFAKVEVVVSKKKFEEDWTRIAHTLQQEGNPRVIVAIGETTYEMINTLAAETDRTAVIQAVVTAEANRTAGALTQADAERVGAAGVVGGRFNWRGVPRPRWYTESAGWQALSVTQRTEAYERLCAQIKGTATVTSRQSKRIWKNVARTLEEKGIVQGAVEDLFLDKGIELVDRTQAAKVDKRDLMLASTEDDMSKLAAIGARFKADVIILGTAAAKSGGEVKVAGTTMYKYTAKLVVRAVRTDTGKLLASKVFSATKTSTQRGGEAKALEKLAQESAPKLLQAVVEAWRRQVNVKRNIELTISGMDYATWKRFQAEVQKLRGTQAVQPREITNNIATISVEYDYDTAHLADALIALKAVKLKVTEITANRIKLEVVRE